MVVTLLDEALNGGAFAEMDGIGRAWAAELKKTGVEGVVLPAT